MTRLISGARWVTCVVLLAVVAACTPAAAEPTALPSAPPSAMPAGPDLPAPPAVGGQSRSGEVENLSGDCNTTSWTWPLCDISRPTRPSFRMPGRPDLTPKDNVWCTAQYIPASSSGWTYWSMVSHKKIKLRFWPDYAECMFYAMYWNGSQWAWIPYDKNYPNAIVGQMVYCDV